MTFNLQDFGLMAFPVVTLMHDLNSKLARIKNKVVSDLAKGDLHSSQVVVVTQVGAGVVNVVDPQLQILNRLEVIIQPKALAEGRVGRVLDALRATQLAEGRYGLVEPTPGPIPNHFRRQHLGPLVSPRALQQHAQWVGL